MSCLFLTRTCPLMPCLSLPSPSPSSQPYINKLNQKPLNSNFRETEGVPFVSWGGKQRIVWRRRHSREGLRERPCLLATSFFAVRPTIQRAASLSLSFSVSLCGGGGGKEKRLRKEGTMSSKPRKETELRYGTFLSEFGVSFIIGRFWFHRGCFQLYHRWVPQILTVP